MAETNSSAGLDAKYGRICQSDSHVDVFRFLSEHSTATLDEQVAVLLIDQARTWRSGQQRSVEEYLAKLPALATRPDLRAQLVIEEYGYRKEHGVRLSPSEMLKRFPDLQAELSTLFAPDERAALPPQSDDRQDSTLIQSLSAADSSFDTTVGPTSSEVSHAGLAHIGDYEILSEIARGGMGVVYKARHRTLGRLAAVKLIKSGELAGSEEVQRFQVEAQAAAVLDHPGIVSVYEVGQQGQQHFLAMAYVDGQSLWQRVKEAPLAPKEAARITQHVAEAVQYAHDHGIVHRDLKPQNILLTKDGQPKVTDFGLAKKQGGDSSLTATGQILGTPSYMPPEQTKGTSDQVGPLADVYSLGATLYCLLTGRPPFQAATPLETMLQVSNQEPVPLRQLNPSIPRELETICLKCLQKNPAQRYLTAGELAADLARYLADEPILARPIGRIEKIWRWCRKRPAVAGLIAASLLIVALGGAISWIAREAGRAQQEARLIAEFEKLLDESTSDTSFIDRGETLLTALSVFAPERIAQDELRLTQTFATAIQADILQSKVSADDEQRLAGALKKLAKREPDEAARLQKRLDGRRRDWQSLAEISAPYANLESAFSADDVEVQDGRLVRRTPSIFSAPSTEVDLWTKISAPGKARLETTFEIETDTTGQLGIEFRYDEQNRYLFLITAERPAGVEPPETSAVRPTFAAARRDNGQLIVQILRNTVPLRSQTISLATLPERHLRLDARREADRLEFRVGDAEPLVFEDIFAIRSRNPARMGLLWSQGPGLINLRASTMPASETVNPLEEGDALFAGGNYEAALARYRESATVTADDVLRREARYKQGVCLQELRRTDEAAEVFEALIAEPGDRWPMLAAIQLWVLQIRTQQREAADATFDVITGRYSFDELARLVPENLRTELIRLYQPPNTPLILRVLTYDPQRIRTLERYALMLDLFHDREHDRQVARWVVIDAVRASGKHDVADQLLDAAMKRAESLPTMEGKYNTYLVSLRLAREFRRNRAENMLEELTAAMTPAQGWDKIPQFWLWRAQCEAHLENWTGAVASLQQGEKFVAPGNEMGWWKLTAYPLLGFLREKMGDANGALAAWRAGAHLDEQEKAGRTTWLHYLLVRGLSRDVDRNDAEVIISGRLTNLESGTIGAAARGFFSPDLFALMAREMFQTPHGREIAWQIASGEVFPSEQAEKVATLLVYEFFRQGAFEGTMSPEQHDVIWLMVQKLVQAAAHEGRFSTLQVGQSALAWKGTLNVLGWGGLAGSLPSEFRAFGAYALGHRMLRRSQPAEAAKLFDEALAHAASDSTLAKLARQDAELAKAGAGLLTLRSGSPQPVQIEVLSGDQVVQAVLVDRETQLDLPAGDYQLRVKDLSSEIRLKPDRLSMTVCGRRFVECEWLWQPGPTDGQFPGPVAAPTRASGMQRWQVIQRMPSARITAAALDPEGQRVACASGGGVVRVYRVEDNELLAAFPTYADYITSLTWSADGQQLLSTSLEAAATTWNVTERRAGVIRVKHPYSGNLSVWGPGLHAVTLVYELTHVQILDAAGVLQRTIDAPSVVRSLAWNGNGTQLAIGLDEEVLLWDNVQLQQRLLAGPVNVTTLAWDIEGSYLAVGTDQEVQVWNVAENSKTSTWPCDNRPTSLAFDKASGRLAAGTSHGWVYLFQKANADPLWKFQPVEGPLCVQWSHDSGHVFAVEGHGGYGRHAILSAADGASVSRHEFPRVGIIGAKLSPDSGRILKCGFADGVWECWDTRGRFLSVMAAPLDAGQTIKLLQWSPDGKWVAGRRWDSGDILITDSATGKVQAALTDITGQKRLLAWNDDSQQLAIANEDSLRIWNAADGTTGPAVLLPNKLRAMSWRPGTSLVTVLIEGEDRSLTTYSAPTLQLEAPIPLPVDVQPLDFRWRPDGRQLVVTMRDALGVVANPDGEILFTLTKLTGAYATDLSWSPDLSKLAVQHSGARVEVFTADGTAVSQRPSYPGALHSPAWSPDGNLLFNWNYDQTLYAWDARTGTVVRSGLFLPDRQAIFFGPGGNVLSSTPEAWRHVVYLVEGDGNTIDIVEPAEFYRRLGAELPKAAE